LDIIEGKSGILCVAAKAKNSDGSRIYPKNVF
jgi:hypothetical protein